MKRSEIKNNCKSWLGGFRSVVSSAPERAVTVAFVLGLVLGLVPRFFAPVIVLIAILVVAFWFLAEPDTATKTTEGDDSDKKESSSNSVPSNGTRSSESGGVNP